MWTWRLAYVHMLMCGMAYVVEMQVEKQSQRISGKKVIKMEANQGFDKKIEGYKK